MSKTVDVKVTTMDGKVTTYRLDTNSQHYVQQEVNNSLSWDKKAGNIKDFEFVESPRVLDKHELLKALEPAIEAEKTKRLPKAKLRVGAWEQAWLESESGWGQRSDGYFYYADEATAKAETAKIEKSYRASEAADYKKSGRAPECYSRPDGEPRFVQVSQALAKEIEQKGVAYRDQRDK